MSVPLLQRPHTVDPYRRARTMGGEDDLAAVRPPRRRRVVVLVVVADVAVLPHASAHRLGLLLDRLKRLQPVGAQRLGLLRLGRLLRSPRL